MINGLSERSHICYNGREARGHSLEDRRRDTFGPRDGRECEDVHTSQLALNINTPSNEYDVTRLDKALRSHLAAHRGGIACMLWVFGSYQD